MATDLSPRRRDPSNALAVPMPRFSVKYDDIDLNKVDPTLLQLVRAGSEWLPEGYRVVVTSGDRPNPSLKGSRHKGGRALDVEIIDPNGNAIPNEGAPGGGPMYRRLAHGVYNEALKVSPELAAQVGWGGEFESVPPTATRRGSGLADFMHFDLGGRRGPPTWRQEGWAMPAAPGSAPPTQLTAAPPVPPITSPLDVGDRRNWPKTYNIPPQLQGPVPVEPLAQTGATAAPAPPAPPPPAYMKPDDPSVASGLTAQRSVPPPVSYTPIADALAEGGVGSESDAPASGPPENMLTGLTQPQRAINIREPFEAQQPPTSYPPGPRWPDDKSDLMSGGVVPGAVAQARQDTNTYLPPANLLAAGGPSEPGPRDTAGAGGPSEDPRDMNSQQMLALMSKMMQGAVKVTPINWNPFHQIMAAGKADTSFPRSALDMSPLGKLTNVHSTEPISSRVAGIQSRPVQAAEASAPRGIYERPNLGLRERKDVRAGAETAA